MRLHAQIQKQREDFEQQQYRERQARYKYHIFFIFPHLTISLRREELDNLLAERNNMKKMEKNVDVELRRRIENDYEQYKQQAVIAKNTIKDVNLLFAEDNFRDHYSKKEQEVHKLLSCNQ